MGLTNPVSSLDRADRESIGPAWDPKASRWLKAGEVRAVYLALPELSLTRPWRAMFAVGTFAGLRTGEVIALEWRDVDFVAGTIQVQRSIGGPLKDDESRVAPLPATLTSVLTEWRKICPVGSEQMFPPTTGRGAT
jgi:integrase